MKTKLFVIVSLFVFTSFTKLISIGCYVATWGDDNNPGTELLPFKTIQKAADVAVGGDEIRILRGVYNEHVIIKNSKPELLFFRAEGDSVIIDGTGFDVYWSGIIDIVGQSNIFFQGLRVINSNGAGFWCDSSENIIFFSNSTFNTASSGIAAWNSKNIKINGNTIENACSNMSQECITVARCDSFEVTGNKVSNCYKEGMCLKDGSSNGIVRDNTVYDVINKLGIYVDAWDKHTFNIEVFNNLVHNCNAGVVLASEMGGLLENIWVYNNVIYDNKFLGIDVSYNGDDTTVTYHPIKDVYIINNTVVKNGYEWGGGIANSNRDATNIIVRNNICSENRSFQIAHEGINPSNMTIDHNLIWDFLEYPDEERGTDFVEADPMFVDTANKDFYLLSNSPAIDAGSPELAPDFAFRGGDRPQGKGFDIGAYEYLILDAEEKGNNIESIIGISPNPFSEFCTIKSDSYAVLEIFDLFGRSIIKAKGQIVWEPDGSLSQGIYFVKFKINNKTQTKPIVFLK
ncbi:MAG: T9SS type A sorting domain-containing protein [Bacteroidetes bacterium]|nr:MAG: T9SS type A sorting domain-containing protein [Bacteroidota bacterium]